jgi:hypothetical protein
MVDPADDQARDWRRLYTHIGDFLAQFGTLDTLGNADYWLLDDNWGGTQQKIFVNNLTMLEPRVITGLQRLLSDFPKWEIVVAVSLRGPAEKWPDMGLTIRRHEIVDGLQRGYFPLPFQSLRYEGSRPGTDRD